MRQQLVDGMPVVQTAMRVPGGDAVQRVYGAPAGDVGEVAVVEIANESPAPFVVALVVRGASAVDLDGATRCRRRAQRDPHAAAAVALGRERRRLHRGDGRERRGLGRTRSPTVRTAGRASSARSCTRSPTAPRLRAVVSMRHAGARRDRSRRTARRRRRSRAGGRPSSTAALRVELPDEPLQRAVDTARAATVLAGQAWRVDPEVAAVLEDWGLDAEAAVGVEPAHRPGPPPARRRRARPRRRGPRSWRVRPTRRRSCSRRCAPVLVREQRRRRSTLLADWPREWIGSADRRARRADPARPVSCSVRWHGERPALLWEVPGGRRRSPRPGSTPAGRRARRAARRCSLRSRLTESGRAADRPVRRRRARSVSELPRSERGADPEGARAGRR